MAGGDGRRRGAVPGAVRPVGHAGRPPGAGGRRHTRQAGPQPHDVRVLHGGGGGAAAGRGGGRRPGAAWARWCATPTPSPGARADRRPGDGGPAGRRRRAAAHLPHPARWGRRTSTSPSPWAEELDVDLPLATLALEHLGAALGVPSERGTTTIAASGAGMRCATVYGWDVRTGEGDFVGLTVDHLFAEIWARRGPDPRDRRLLLIGLLVGAGGLDDVHRAPARQRPGAGRDGTGGAAGDRDLPHALRRLAHGRQAQRHGRGAPGPARPGVTRTDLAELGAGVPALPATSSTGPACPTSSALTGGRPCATSPSRSGWGRAPSTRGACSGPSGSRATTWRRSSRGCSSTSGRRRSSWTSATGSSTRTTASSGSTHCGALMDVEPMGDDFVVAMCHHIEDPTFDATACATNPRARMRPIHRPPRRRPTVTRTATGPWRSTRRPRRCRSRTRRCGWRGPGPPASRWRRSTRPTRAGATTPGRSSSTCASRTSAPRRCTRCSTRSRSRATCWRCRSSTPWAAAGGRTWPGTSG